MRLDKINIPTFICYRYIATNELLPQQRKYKITPNLDFHVQLFLNHKFIVKIILLDNECIIIN